MSMRLACNIAFSHQQSNRLKEEIEAAQGESLRAFGSDQLLIEKYFESIRHVEVKKKKLLPTCHPSKFSHSFQIPDSNLW